MTFGHHQFDEITRRIIEAELEKPIPMERLSTRSGGQAGSMVYVPGNVAIDLANFMFGFNGWSSTVNDLKLDFEDKDNNRWNVCASAIVTVSLSDGTSRQDVGCGDSINKSRAKALESAKKEAVTDAIKRALRQLGNGLGNCIYDSKYVKEVKRGRGGQYVPSVPSRASLYPNPTSSSHCQQNQQQENSSMQQQPGNQGPLPPPPSHAATALRTKSRSPESRKASETSSTGPIAHFKQDGNAYIVSEATTVQAECRNGSWSASAHSNMTVAMAGGAQRQDTGFGFAQNQNSRRNAEDLAKEYSEENGMKRVHRQISGPEASGLVSASHPTQYKSGQVLRNHAPSNPTSAASNGRIGLSSSSAAAEPNGPRLAPGPSFRQIPSSPQQQQQQQQQLSCRPLPPSTNLQRQRKSPLESRPPPCYRPVRPLENASEASVPRIVASKSATSSNYSPGDLPMIGSVEDLDQRFNHPRHAGAQRVKESHITVRPVIPVVASPLEESAHLESLQLGEPRNEQFIDQFHMTLSQERTLEALEMNHNSKRLRPNS